MTAPVEYDLRPNGGLVAVIDGVRYTVAPLDVLDDYLRLCPPEHRDPLLDVRIELYPPGTSCLS